MFGRNLAAALSVLAMAVLLLPLAGCSTGVEKFSELDSQRPEDEEHRGVLVPAELDVNNDGFITPEELRGANTYPRTVDEFFADGNSSEDKELTEEEFAKALLGKRMPAWQIGLIALAVVVVPLPIGFQIAKSLRMPDYGWQIAVILLSITAGGAIAYFGWPPKLGIDLSGGIILIYEIDEEATREQLGDEIGLGADVADIDSDLLASQLRRRINPGGVSEIVVRPYGPRQVEIIIPNVEDAEIEYYKSLIERTGQLEFFIVANREDHQELIDKALENIDSRSRVIRNEQGKTIGRWVPVGVSQQTREEAPNYRGISLSDVMRARRGASQDFVLVDTSEARPLLDMDDPNFKQAFDRLGYRDLELLMEVNPVERMNVKGQHVRSAAISTDQVGNPAVRFTMTGAGSTLLGSLTARNQPDPTTGFHRRMAIVMDNQVMSAPQLNDVISESGIITGDFTQDEVKELVGVLNAGRLPAVMRKDPISENRVSPLLGADTIRSGSFAIGLSLVAVLIFMVFYYRFAGLVACVALLVNLLLILALMILVNATFSLPGLAGLVLTVGMSVDANVLIFERIREELSRGAALRMAIRNGFQRATTTIVDANVTTLITGIVLYVIGTETIRGFAVTLILGILMCMYTAIFCSRVVFDIAERKRWVSQLKMLQIIGSTHIDFLSRRKIAGAISVVLIFVGIGALVARGKGILDIDFLGGTSVQILLKEPMSIADVRDRVEGGRLGDVSVVGVPVDDAENPERKTGEYRSFIINSSITGEERPEEGDPVTYAPPGQTAALDYVVVNVDAENQKVDLESLAGEVVEDVDWNDIERDGVAVVQKRITELFPTELSYHSMEVRELAAVTDGDEVEGGMPEVEEPETTEENSSPADPAEIDVGGREPPGDEDTRDPESGETDAQGNEGDTSEPTDGSEEEPSGGSGSAPASEADAAAPEPASGGTNEIDSGDPGAPPTEAEDGSGDNEPENEKAEPQPAPEANGKRVRDSVFSLASYQVDPTLLAQADSADPSGEADVPDESAEPRGDDSVDADQPVPGEEEGPAADGPAMPAEDVVDSDDSLDGRTRATLKFDHAMTAANVRDLIRKAIGEMYGDIELPRILVSNPQWDGASGQRFDEWTVEIPLSADATEDMLKKIESEQAVSPVWLSSNKIGGQVAGNLQQQAVAALLASLVGIIAYIWLRFQRVVFGLAAVVALVHDVLITLGAIAASLWVAQATMGVLLIDEFKISLPIVAALLTIIGYSLNDTIVVFDRIREVRGKNPGLTQDMINTSINQTLGRTLLTSLTTLLVVLLLYVLGGQAIRGFAFALLVGVMVGTYSSIFVASPCLHWMMNTSKVSKSQPNQSAPATTKA